MATLTRRGRPPTVTIDGNHATVVCKGITFTFLLSQSGRIAASGKDTEARGGTEEFNYARSVVRQVLG